MQTVLTCIWDVFCLVFYVCHNDPSVTMSVQCKPTCRRTLEMSSDFGHADRGALLDHRTIISLVTASVRRWVSHEPRYLDTSLWPDLRVVMTDQICHQYVANDWPTSVDKPNNYALLQWRVAEICCKLGCHGRPQEGIDRQGTDVADATIFV